MPKNTLLLLLQFLLLNVINSCQSLNSVKKIQGIEVTGVTPMGQSSYRSYFNGSLILYQFEYRFDSSVMVMGSNKKQTQSEWRNEYFIFHQDSTYGYNYDPKNPLNNNLRLKVDSMVNLIKGTNNLDSFCKIRADSSIWNSSKSKLKEVYFFPEAKDEPTGRVILYYSKDLNNLRESFNRKVDSIKKMKLYRMENRVNQFYSKKDKKLWPPMTDVFEMKEIKSENLEEILSYFQKYSEMERDH